MLSKKGKRTHKIKSLGREKLGEKKKEINKCKLTTY
jgi:hypothetical protein